MRVGSSSEEAQRAAIVAEARRWLGTPYHNCADILGVGVDCGMLIVRVFVDVGLVEAFDPRPYRSDWMLHNDGEKYLGWVRTWCDETDDPQPGDLAVFRFGRCYSHGGIVTQAAPRALIHAFADAGCVVEERFHQNPALVQRDRHLKFFSFWAKREV